MNINIKENIQNSNINNNFEETSSKAKHYVVSTLFNTSLFVLVSFLTKAIHLTFTVLTARIVSKESYGLTHVYFNLIFLLLHHFPKETLRKTCLKYCPDENEENENKKFLLSCNLIWLMNLCIIIFSIPLNLIFIYFGSSSNGGVSENKIHLFIYTISAILELISEPVIIYSSIKIEEKFRLVGMSITNYSKIISTFLFAYFFGLDLWAFTLARLFSSLLHLIFYASIGIFKYKLNLSIFVPNFKGMISIRHNKEIISTFNSFIKGISLKMILNYAERIVLSFFIIISDIDKGEYLFVIDNFSTFIKFVVEPAEENFYNLINKIKHYKGLSIIKGEEFSGDFSKNENEILIKLYSNFNKKEKDKENYSFKLLKLTLKIFFVVGIILFSYIFLIGRELVIYIFTEKWGTEHTISILKVYALYVGVMAVTSVIEAYSNAISSNEKMNFLNNLMIFNALLLLFFSVFLSQYDITGLVWANIVTLLLRFFVNLYLVISIELEDQINQNLGFNNNNGEEENKFIDEANYEPVRKVIRPDKLIGLQCVKSSQIILEMLRFLNKSFMKTPAIISTVVCLLILNIIKDLVSYEENHFLLISSSCVVLTLNFLLIFMVEKKGFIEIIRLKTSHMRV